MTLSVIVPVYNVEKYLDECVQSMVNQTFTDCEVILVDDGSTDSSGAKCDAWADKDSRIRAIHKENGGPSRARQAGIKTAQGRFLAFVDSDDKIENNMYNIMQSAQAGKDYDYVICGLKRFFTEEGDIRSKSAGDNQYIVVGICFDATSETIHQDNVTFIRMRSFAFTDKALYNFKKFHSEMGGVGRNKSRKNFLH